MGESLIFSGALRGGVLVLRTCRKGWGTREERLSLAFPLVSTCVVLYRSKPARQVKQRRQESPPFFFSREKRHKPREAALLAQGCTGVGKNTDILPTSVFVLG